MISQFLRRVVYASQGLRKYSQQRLIIGGQRRFNSGPSSNKSRIQQKLVTSLKPTHLDIEDVSGGCGEFFRLLIVSKEFEGKSIMQQHKLVKSTIAEEIKGMNSL